MDAVTGSRGEIRAVSDDEILDAYSFLGASEGVFCEPASAAVGRRPAEVRRRGRGRVRAHRPRPEGPADGDDRAGVVVPLRAGHRALEAAVLG